MPEGASLTALGPLLVPGVPLGLDEQEEREADREEAGQEAQEAQEGATPPPGGELGAAVAAALQAALERTGELPPAPRTEPNGDSPPALDHSQPLDLLDTSTAPWLTDPELGVQWAESWIASHPGQAETEPPGTERPADDAMTPQPEVAEIQPPASRIQSPPVALPEPAPLVVRQEPSPPPAEPLRPPSARPYQPRSLETLLGRGPAPAPVPPPMARYVPSQAPAPIAAPVERPTSHEPARPKAAGGWMVAVTMGLVLGLLAGLIAYAIGPATHDVYLSRYVVPVADLPAALEGLHLVQVTDLHLPRGADVAGTAAQRVVDAKADVLLLTGDLLDDASPGALAALDRFLGVAHGTRGTFAILGEREAALREPLRALYERHGVRLLSGDRAAVDIGGVELIVHSLGDPSDKVPIVPATFTRGDAPARRRVDVWMVHAPQSVMEIPRSDLRSAAFIVAGHTLGGPLGLPSFAGASRYRSGWYSLDATHLYVSNGVGTGRIPARLLAPAEVTRFTLRRATRPYATPERE